MDLLEFLLGVAQAILIIGALLWLPLRSAWRARKWKALAEQLGLRHGTNTLQGEYQGLAVRVHTEFRDTGDEWDAYCVVRATVPGELPPGFLAVPRAWAPAVARVPADKAVATDERALDKVLVFQADRPSQGARLLEVPEVREALLALGGRRRKGLVEKGDVAIAHESDLGDPKKLRDCLDAVAHAARVLAAAESSWRERPSAPAATR
jgi:hypothetical protein